MTRQTNNNIKLRTLPESTFDTLPSGTSVDWRGVTSETIAPVPEWVTSDEEIDTLADADHLLVGMGTRGDVNVEWSYGAHDDHIARAIGSAGWSSELADPGGSVTVTFSTSGGVNSMQLSGSTAWNSASGMGSTLARGMWLKVADADTANNGYWRIESATTGDTINVSGLNSSGATMSSQTIAFSSVTVIGMAQVLNGTVAQDTIAIEKDLSDLSGSDRYHHCLGQLCTGYTVGFANPKSLVTGAFSFIGTRITKASSPISGSPTPITSGGVYTAAQVWGFLEDIGSSSSAQPIVSWNLRVLKGDYAFDEAGNLRPQGFGRGRITVTGSFQAHIEESNIFDRSISETGSNSTALALVLENSGGTIIHDVPAVRLQNPRVLKGARDQATLQEYDFIGRYHVASSAALRVCRTAS